GRISDSLFLSKLLVNLLGYSWARVFPRFLQASFASSSGSSLQSTPSCIRFAPASLQEASQFRIHSPSPQPYEPKRPIFFPDKPFLQSSNIGANSVSSSSSSPIEGQPKAMASYSAILSPEKAAASNTS